MAVHLHYAVDIATHTTHTSKLSIQRQLRQMLSLSKLLCTSLSHIFLMARSRATFSPFKTPMLSVCSNSVLL